MNLGFSKVRDDGFYCSFNETVKPEKIRNFQKWQNNNNNNNNCQNGSGKPRKLSRSRMTKLTTLLDSSREI